MGDRAHDLIGVPLLVSVLPSDLARTRGGGERYAFELQAALAEQLPEWDLLGLVAVSERASELVPAGWHAVTGSRARELSAADAIPLAALLEQVPAAPDVLICHQWRTRTTAALRVRHRRHRGGHLVGIDYGGGSVAGYRLNRLPLPRADLGAHISLFEQDVSPIRAHRHVVARGGIDPRRFRPPADERRNLDFLMVGRFLPHKGQAVFLDALPDGARALLIGPSASGDAIYLGQVRERAAEKGVELRFDASDDELIEAYRRARFTVQVPVVTVERRDATPPELLGLTMLEAMACGSVPICPVSGASAEFVGDGRTGLTYAAGSRDDLARVLAVALRVEDKGATLRRAALEEVRHWTWPAAAGALLGAL